MFPRWNKINVNINLKQNRKHNKLAVKMLLKKHEVQTLVHHVKISIIYVYLLMLGITTVFGWPYIVSQFRIDFLISKSRDRKNGVYEPEGIYFV